MAEITHKMTLTDLENRVLWKVLDRVNENLSLDRESGEYRENHEDFILTLTLEEKRALDRCIRKSI